MKGMSLEGETHTLKLSPYLEYGIPNFHNNITVQTMRLAMVAEGWIPLTVELECPERPPNLTGTMYMYVPIYDRHA